MFAAGKKRKNASLTYGQTYGAATMNNTMVLGIFFTLVYAKVIFEIICDFFAPDKYFNWFNLLRFVLFSPPGSLLGIQC